MPKPVTALVWDDEAGGLVEMPIFGAEPEPEPVRRGPPQPETPRRNEPRDDNRPAEFFGFLPGLAGLGGFGGGIQQPYIDYGGLFGGGGGGGIMGGGYLGGGYLGGENLGGGYLGGGYLGGGLPPWPHPPVHDPFLPPWQPQPGGFQRPGMMPQPVAVRPAPQQPPKPPRGPQGQERERAMCAFCTPDEEHAVCYKPENLETRGKALHCRRCKTMIVEDYAVFSTRVQQSLGITNIRRGRLGESIVDTDHKALWPGLGF
ncbi:Protein of unknown function [Pyronema omphalodes CBS 100304]|uniref:Uncharacterized protein n=1 Tax=Pyronema omphalodes (strain CBS 100304) TaxID=1076935 RepID=U4KU10_PYROM|nr:Protein of unknown function [Pyronema omphalodes CBS 100304]